MHIPGSLSLKRPISISFDYPTFFVFGWPHFPFHVVPATNFCSLLVDNPVSETGFEDWSGAKPSFYPGSADSQFALTATLPPAYNVARRHYQSLCYWCSALITMRTRRIIRRHFQSATLFVGQQSLSYGVKGAFVEVHIFADG